MGRQQGGRSDEPRAHDDVVWAFDGDGTRERWAADAGADEVDGPAEALDGAGSGARPETVPDANRAHRRRRWANRLAVAALAALVLLGLARALRGDRTHRLIQRDVQHVVQLEAQALAEGDRELFMSLQDASRRRLLRRPDVAADARRVVGPWPGVYFTDDPPRVTNVEVAAKDAAHSVEAVTATVQVAATVGARVGRFEQARRMAHRADGVWLHAAASAGRGVEDGAEVERFVSSRIHASFPAADGPLLRPVLERANAAVRAYCADQGRCTGRARLAFGSVDGTSADVAFRLIAPSSPSGWQPVDEAARGMLAFSIARAAALRLDYAFDRTFRPDGTSFTWPDGQGRDGAIVTALVDAVLASHLDPTLVDAWAADGTAADAGLTLWHFGDMVWRPRYSGAVASSTWRVLPQRDVTIAARNFASVTLRRDPARLSAAMAAWPDEINRTGDDWLSPASIERDFGPGGLATVLDWPAAQAPFIADRAIVLACGSGEGRYLVGQAEGIADLGLLACGGDAVMATAWSPDGAALAVACDGNVGQAEPVARADRGTVALVRRAAAGGWSVAPAPPSILAAVGGSVESLVWAPDGRHLAFEASTRERPDGDASPLRHVGLVAVHIAAADPWSPQTDRLPLPAVRHPETGEPVQRYAFHAPRLAWSPDGRVLAVVGNNTIVLQPADGGPASALGGWAMAWSPDGARIARLLGPLDGAEPAASATNGAFALSVVDTRTMTETAAIRLAAANTQRAPDRRFHPVPADDVADILDLAWSDDGRWVGAAFHTSTRCGDRVDCAVGFAWQPESAVLRQVVNAPQMRDGASWWQWRGGWLSGSHRYGVFNDDPYWADLDGADDDAPIAFVLDADTDDGRIETLTRAESPALSTLLLRYSPDGRWHARLDAMSTLVVEPASGIGGYRAGDAATGWRFNRPFCSSHVLWAGSVGERAR